VAASLGPPACRVLGLGFRGWDQEARGTRARRDVAFISINALYMDDLRRPSPGSLTTDLTLLLTQQTLEALLLDAARLFCRPSILAILPSILAMGFPAAAAQAEKTQSC